MAHGQVVLSKAVISEAEIDLSFQKRGVERQHFPEFFCSSRELALPQRLLAGTKVRCKLILRGLTQSAESRQQKRTDEN